LVCKSASGTEGRIDNLTDSDNDNPMLLSDEAAEPTNQRWLAARMMLRRTTVTYTDAFAAGIRHLGPQ
jgi:hypothetical protein